PAWRVFAGLTWAPRDFDRDRDGVLDEQDQCPNRVEDLDGFEDDDGCPDEDNDKDGVPDTEDRCPLEAEDVDGFQDGDGCPDEDNDGDGISDLDDGCPDRPEDVDGFQDDDGCPDEDNDGDGIPDPQDLCPFEPEDRDGFQDDDGCPDSDDDGDGIPDGADRCPGQVETYNAKDDADGCPDEKLGKSLLTLDADAGLIRQVIPVRFVKSESEVLPASYPALEQLASLLRLHQGLLRVRIIGHAEAKEGDAGFRRILGEARAQAVLAYLLDSGVEAQKIEAISGEPEVQVPVPRPAPATAEEPPAPAVAPADVPARPPLPRQAGETVIFQIMEMSGK
ncbi:MAG: thrombospondin, partial [Deltaproteobacteria bacterium]|nr:thrombospondin [Deltaproteobacteria bacterium]